MLDGPERTKNVSTLPSLRNTGLSLLQRLLQSAGDKTVFGIAYGCLHIAPYVLLNGFGGAFGRLLPLDKAFAALQHLNSLLILLY